MDIRELKIEMPSSEDLIDLRNFLLIKNNTIDPQEIHRIPGGFVREPIIISLVVPLVGPVVIRQIVSLIKEWLRLRHKEKKTMKLLAKLVNGRSQQISIEPDRRRAWFWRDRRYGLQRSQDFVLRLFGAVRAQFAERDDASSRGIMAKLGSRSRRGDLPRRAGKQDVVPRHAKPTLPGVLTAAKVSARQVPGKAGYISCFTAMTLVSETDARL